MDDLPRPPIDASDLPFPARTRVQDGAANIRLDPFTIHAGAATDEDNGLRGWLVFMQDGIVFRTQQAQTVRVASHADVVAFRISRPAMMRSTRYSKFGVYRLQLRLPHGHRTFASLRFEDAENARSILTQLGKIDAQTWLALMLQRSRES
jgi:hypothetical protein